ncbi:exocyst complex component 3-like protein 4 [Elgaria multicarinata webbii]|uniref:exocyst complex component 3-like protein 4 n=1 Tax=Elgaria multicarinata webbii TaxID=159646 RepID=UPI002FCCDF86
MGQDGRLPKDAPPSKNQSENETKTFNRGFISKLSLRRTPSRSERKSMDESIISRVSRRVSSKSERKSLEESVISRVSRRFSLRSFKLREEVDHAGKENGKVPKKDDELGGEDCVHKEPLSVMEMHELIQKRQLLKAFKNITALETELLAERDAKKYEDNPKEYNVKVKDVTLLYDSISKEIQCIVEETLDQPREDVLTSLVALIEEEEKTHAGAANTTVPSEPGSLLGLARNWRELWGKTVTESVKARVLKVPIPLKEEPSWLSVHLGYLKNVIRGDLLTIKLWAHQCYPPDYDVCNTYLKAFHGALSPHLQSILEENSSLEFNEYYAVLDWVTNVYHSEDFLGHPDLKPEMKTEDLPNLLTPQALDKLKNDYINSIKLKTKSCFENILLLETNEKWDSEEEPEALQSQYHSSLSFDIQTIIGQHMKASGSICKKLETAVLENSLKEVIEFIPRFGKAFLEWDKMKDHPQSVPFMVAYINSFHDLRIGLRENLNVSCKELEKTVANETLRWRKYFLNKLRLNTKPMFKKILSQAWILNGGTLDSLIMKILLDIENFSNHLIHLKKPICTDFLNEVHKYVVKEYITQTLKSKYKIKSRKRKEISKIMTQEATAISNTMRHLGSTSDWLFPAIPHIADIIGEKKKSRIKDYIDKLTSDYPDIRKEHILAVLALRGLSRKRRNSIAHHVDQPSEELDSGSHQTLFAEIELGNTILCF